NSSLAVVSYSVLITFLVEQILQFQPDIAARLEEADPVVAPLDLIKAQAHPEGIPERPVDPRLQQVRPRPVVEEGKAGPQVTAHVLGADVEGQHLRGTREGQQALISAWRQVAVG